MSMATDLYPHMPILRPHAVRYSTNNASLAWQLRRRISTPMFTFGCAWPTGSPILGFWGSKVHKNKRFPAVDADEQLCKIWRH